MSETKPVTVPAPWQMRAATRIEGACPCQKCSDRRARVATIIHEECSQEVDRLTLENRVFAAAGDELYAKYKQAQATIAELRKALTAARDTLATFQWRNAGKGVFRISCPEHMVKQAIDVSDAALARTPKEKPCSHERLTEDGICRSCGADKRGIG